MLQVNIADFTDHQWVTCFQETAEILLGNSFEFHLTNVKGIETTYLLILADPPYSYNSQI